MCHISICIRRGHHCPHGTCLQKKIHRLPLGR
jgi:hypothetical protein